MSLSNGNTPTLIGMTLRAWALVAGTGVNGAQTIVKSGGVTSVSRVSSSNWNVVFSSAMSSVNWILVARGDTGTGAVAVGASNKTVNGSDLKTTTLAGANTDPSHVLLEFWE